MTLMVCTALADASLAAAPRVRETKEQRLQRAARLLTPEERFRIDEIDREIAGLPHPASLRVTNIAAVSLFAVSAVMPAVGLVLGVGALLYVIFVLPFVALSGGSGASLYGMFHDVLGWIPIWGWATMGIVAGLAAITLLVSFLIDVPRQNAIAKLQAERATIEYRALQRGGPEPIALAPMATVFRF